MFSTKNNVKGFHEHVNYTSNMENTPNLFSDPSPRFANLKKYVIYLLIIITFSFSIAAYIKQSHNTPSSDEFTELEVISNNIFLGNTWDKKQINTFLYHWGNLSKNQRHQLQNVTWFQQFSLSLLDHLARSNRAVDSNAFLNNNKNDLLRTLAIVIDARHTADMIAMQARRNNTITHTTPNKTALQPSNPEQHKQHTTSRAKAITRISHADSSETATHPNATQLARQTISAAPAARTTKHDNLTQPSRQQSKSTTTSLQSKTNSQVAKSKKSTNVALMSTRTSPKQLGPTKHLPQKSTDRTRFNKYPTPAELDKVVNQYIDAFEQGNAHKILDLLSTNVRTNTANNATEVEQNLKELFASTTDRQLFIRNIKWKYDKNIAKGVGDIQTLLLHKDNSKVIATKGKIQIIAKKVNNAVLVTHIFTTKHTQ